MCHSEKKCNPFNQVLVFGFRGSGDVECPACSDTGVLHRYVKRRSSDGAELWWVYDTKCRVCDGKKVVAARGYHDVLAMKDRMRLAKKTFEEIRLMEKQGERRAKNKPKKKINNSCGLWSKK